MNRSKVIGVDDPTGARIMMEVERCKHENRPYPLRRVDDFQSTPKVWLGKSAYHPETLERLRLTPAARRRPIPLPDGFVIDGDSRLPKETAVQFAKYCAYRDLGADRTVAAAARAYGVSGSAADWRVLSARMRWHERAALWDADLDARTQLAIEKKIEAVVDEYAERRANYLARELNLVEMTFTRLEEMLSLPARDKRVELEDGKTILHWHAANWSYGDIAKLIAEMKTMARLNHGLPTSNTSLKIDQSVSGTISVNHTASALADAGSMTPAQRAAHEYAARKSETAYFDALAEYEAKQSSKVIEGALVADS